MKNDYYENLFYAILRTDKIAFYDALLKEYRTKGAVTRWLRAQPKLEDDDGFPLYTIAVHDGDDLEDCVLVASIPAELWLQIVAKPC